VQQVTNAEKGKATTVMACCSAKRNFIHTFMISKARERRLEFSDAMPTGVIVRISETGCINSELFSSALHIYKCSDFVGLSFLSWMVIAVMLAMKKHCLFQTEATPHGCAFHHTAHISCSHWTKDFLKL
jgi:hypothetical protein